MPQERELAVVDKETILRKTFTNNYGERQSVDIQRVDIMDGIEVVYSLTGIIQDGVGEFHVIDPPHVDPVVLIDRWVYKRVDNALEYEHASGFVVRRYESTEADVLNLVQQCYIYVVDLNGSPMPGVTVIVSDPGGLFIGSKASDSNGLVKPALPAGEYVLSLKKGNKVFSANNFEVEVIESPTLPVNRFYLRAKVFTPTEPALNKVSIWDKCEVSVYLSDITGAPVQGAKVLLESESLTSVQGTLLENVGIVQGRVVVELDSHGYAKFFALRNSSVRVVIEGTGINRQIQIPDKEFANLVDLVTEAEDIFTVINRPRTTLARDI